MRQQELTELHREAFQRAVLTWFDLHGRKYLPWQQMITPYRVWVSEIMLQQTQVATVIDYFHRFMQRFPSVHALADAQLDEVMQLWTGLGYYSRARNLHRCAQDIVNKHQGEFPCTVSELEQLPGIGRSTAGAIASLSMGVRAPILDGNVKRVLSRAFAVEGWSGRTDVQKQLWTLAEELTPERNFNAYTQAMMDLGAMVCRRRPECDICPLQTLCWAHQQGRQTELPTPKPKRQNPVKRQLFILLLSSPTARRCSVWLEPRPPAGIWGGLWSVPAVDDEQQLQHWLASNMDDEPTIEQWPTMRHVFSHFTLEFQPIVMQLDQHHHLRISERSGRWFDLSSVPEVGLPAPIVVLLNRLRETVGVELEQRE